MENVVFSLIKIQQHYLLMRSSTTLMCGIVNLFQRLEFFLLCRSQNAASP